MSKNALPESLLPYWSPLTERVGLILSGGRIVELQNESPTPERTLMVRRSLVEQYEDAQAMWHTHPAGNVNLSAADYRLFLSLPHLFHYIVTETRVRRFRVQNKQVMLDEADCL